MKLTGLSPQLTYTPLFSPSQTHAHVHTHHGARAHNAQGFMAPGLGTHAHTTPAPPRPPPPAHPPTHLHHPLHPHISREHHTSCRRSLSCQLQTRCESRMLTERRYVEVTHEPRHVWLDFGGKTGRNASVVWRALFERELISLGCERGAIATYAKHVYNEVLASGRCIFLLLLLDLKRKRHKPKKKRSALVCVHHYFLQAL